MSFKDRFKKTKTKIDTSIELDEESDAEDITYKSSLDFDIKKFTIPAVKSITEKKANISARKQQSSFSEYKISIDKLTTAIDDVEDVKKLGTIVQEIARFLKTLSEEDAYLSIKGNFDPGKKTLLTCLLTHIIQDDNEVKLLPKPDGAIPRLIKKKKQKSKNTITD